MSLTGRESASRCNCGEEDDVEACADHIGRSNFVEFDARCVYESSGRENEEDLVAEENGKRA